MSNTGNNSPGLVFDYSSRVMLRRSSCANSGPPPFNANNNNEATMQSDQPAPTRCQRLMRVNWLFILAMAALVVWLRGRPIGCGLRVRMAPSPPSRRRRSKRQI